MMCQWDIVKWKGDKNETRKDIKYKKVTEHIQDRWMWRVPDIMPVSLQDILYSWKPDLWAVQIVIGEADLKSVRC